MQESQTPRDADLIIVNTCTVTQRTDKQVRQAVRRLHRENPRAQLIVTGCYAERDPDALAAMNGVRLVLGNAEKIRLPELVEQYAEFSQGKIIRTSLDEEIDCVLPPMTHTGGKTRPLVKLQDGCDARCSYCIVPHVRGPGRSARPENVLAEIQSLVESGFQEIVLAGINLGAFGQKLKGQPHLADLLRRIVEIPNLGRIRLSSIEPMHLNPAIIEMAAAHPVIARHFHIPMQSGSNRMLRLMRRPYTAARFRELIYRIQRELPDTGIGTDVLVGFPGETDRDFNETRALIEELPLTYLHVFPFSPREGTEAASLPNPTPSHVMRLRLNALLKPSRSKNLAFRRRFVGKVLPAITLAREENGAATRVLTDNYIHASVPALSIEPNRLIEIRIEDVRPEATFAVIH